MTVAFVSHPACLSHDVPAWHPERAQRLHAIEEELIVQGLWDYLRHERAPRAERMQLERVHDPRHVERILDHGPREGLVACDPDTFMGPHSAQAALRATGAVVLATDLVLDRIVERAFCAVRPPGHHAGRDRAMGFCLFNNVAVGVAHALASRRVSRVAVLDFDAHRGNGTEEIFRDDPRVLYCSLYQHPFYPGPPHGAAPDHVVEVRLPAGGDGASFRAGIEQHWLPAVEHARPELVFVSAGFDGHAEDDMTGLRLRDADYRWVSETIVDIADRFAQGRVVSTLEGGYHLASLSRCTALHLRTLMGLW